VLFFVPSSSSSLSWCVASLCPAPSRVCGSSSYNMGDDALDRDARIMLSIGAKYDDQFELASGLVFDHHRGLLLVVDSSKHRVQVFSCDDGSFVSKLGEKGIQPGQLKHPEMIAIDHDHDRILITDSGNKRVQSWSLSDQSFLPCIGHRGSGDLEFNSPRGIAIDKHHHRRGLRVSWGFKAFTGAWCKMTWTSCALHSCGWYCAREEEVLEIVLTGGYHIDPVHNKRKVERCQRMRMPLHAVEVSN